ncbi:hypothetical protein BJ546DRAFT_970087 [Cryomyces antarcticus]
MSTTKHLVERFRRGSVDAEEIKRRKSAVVLEQRRPSVVKQASSFQERLSAPFRSSRLKTESKGDNIDGSVVSSRVSLFDLFCALPNELIAHILCELPLADVSALRLTARSCHHLVSNSESAVVRYWERYKLSNSQKGLFPPPAPSQAKLHYLWGLQRRGIIANKLAVLLTDFVAHEILIIRGKRKRKQFQPIWERMHGKMIPLLLVLTHFLERYRAALLEKCLQDWPPNHGFEILPLGDSTLLPNEKTLMADYDPELLVQCHSMYTFMVQAFGRQLRPPTYASPVERALRGWSAQPPTRHEFATVLVLGGIPAIKDIMSNKTYSERRRAFGLFISGISPRESTRWREHWGKLDTGISLERVPALRVVLPPVHSFWIEAAKGVLLEKEVVKDVEEIKSIREFLSDLVEYDILNPMPAAARQAGATAAEAEDEEPEADEEQDPYEW